MTDLTYVATWAGVAYVCFIVDAFSRLSWAGPSPRHMRTDMVLDGGDGALARGTLLEGWPPLRAGSQFTTIRYGERLAELGACRRSARIGDSYDNALAETVNGLYKTELTAGPTRTVANRRRGRARHARLGALAQHHRLHGYLGDVPPAEFEAAFYAAQQTAHRVGIQ